MPFSLLSSVYFTHIRKSVIFTQTERIDIRLNYQDFPVEDKKNIRREQLDVVVTYDSF